MGMIALRSENVPFWVWYSDWDSLTFAEEKRLIADYRVIQVSVYRPPGL